MRSRYTTQIETRVAAWTTTSKATPGSVSPMRAWVTTR